MDAGVEIDVINVFVEQLVHEFVALRRSEIEPLDGHARQLFALGVTVGVGADEPIDVSGITTPLVAKQVWCPIREGLISIDESLADVEG